MMKNKDNLTGKKVKVIKDSCRHMIPIGTIITLKTRYSGGTNLGYYHSYSSSYISDSDYKLPSISKDEIKDEIEELEDEIFELKSRLAFLEETDSKEFDENEFKVYNTLKIIEKKGLSQIDKAKAIAKLINN